MLNGQAASRLPVQVVVQWVERNATSPVKHCPPFVQQVSVCDFGFYSKRILRLLSQAEPLRDFYRCTWTSLGSIAYHPFVIAPLRGTVWDGWALIASRGPNGRVSDSTTATAIFVTAALPSYLPFLLSLYQVSSLIPSKAGQGLAQTLPS